MGLFLAMSGVVGAKKEAVEAALHTFTAIRKGSLRKTVRSIEDSNTLVLLEHNSMCSVLYPWGFLEWDGVSYHLSAQLGVPVFSFHIHDEDLWMFTLFDDGEQVDQFNPLPDYWDDSISDDERRSWSGDAVVIASRIPDVKPDAISPYLRQWDLDDDNPGKAFPDDQFQYHDCWQMCDFLKRVGLPYPLDRKGGILGETYEFIASEMDSNG